MIDLRRMTRKFIMNEGKQQVNWQALVQSIEEALSSIRTSSLRDNRRVELAKHNLKEIKRHLRKANERIETLEEQLRILEEGTKE
jgi:predicted RNase H-like nuclease (RuvC/YqgF family)|tara:strand:+ start:3192 stop:3446 length:255 start_codon:yes stop_codon:yes gene_type:complete